MSGFLRILLPFWAVAVTVSVVSFQWCKSRFGVGVHCVLRAALWALGMFVALLPAMHASHAEYGFSLADMASAANGAGFYRDFFFITVVCSIVGLSSIFDHIFMKHSVSTDWSRLVFGLLGIYFVVAAIYGVNRFGEIASFKTVPSFGNDLSIIKYTLWAGLLAEITVVLGNARHT